MREWIKTRLFIRQLFIPLDNSFHLPTYRVFILPRRKLEISFLFCQLKIYIFKDLKQFSSLHLSLISEILESRVDLLIKEIIWENSSSISWLIFMAFKERRNPKDLFVEFKQIWINWYLHVQRASLGVYSLV